MSVRQPERCRFVATRQKAFVETIEPSEDALSMEEVVKLFSAAFKQVCRLHEVDKLVSSPVESYHCLGSIDSLPHHPRRMKYKQDLRLLQHKLAQVSIIQHRMKWSI